MRRSWRKIVDVLAAGGILWAGGAPRKRAWLCEKKDGGVGAFGRMVRLSTIVAMEAEDLLQSKEERCSDGTRTTDDYWELTDGAKEIVWPK